MQFNIKLGKVGLSKSRKKILLHRLPSKILKKWSGQNLPKLGSISTKNIESHKFSGKKNSNQSRTNAKVNNRLLVAAQVPKLVFGNVMVPSSFQRSIKKKRQIFINNIQL